MPTLIEVTCPTCGYRWQEDLDRHQTWNVVYRGEEKQQKVEEYRLRCPRDGTYFIAEVSRKE